MSMQLDLADIQGNIVKAYGRYGFPVARNVFFHVTAPEEGRQFVAEITPLVTTSVPWSDISQAPLVTTNIAFTYEGLRHLDVPEDTLHGFPDEFSMGMKARRDIIGDTGPNHYQRWDPVWNDAKDENAQHVHIMISINGREEKYLESRYQQIQQILAKFPGSVSQLVGHRGAGREDLPYQPAAALPGGKEHFGYSDGISDTAFKGGDDDPNSVIGAGKPTGGDPRTIAGWAPLEAGEFLFGYPDEAFEYPEAPGPPLFSRNGTYLVYRKLHQNVGSFNSYLEAEGARFPGGKEALAAKFAGRWRNGAPLVSFPAEEGANQFAKELAALREKARGNSASPGERARLAELKLQLVAFDYNDDPQGAKCPFGAHMRRTNPRSALEFANSGAFDTPGALSNRRRLLRRGLTYGRVEDPTSDDGDHGVIITLLNADLSRQFEFVQQQWLNFGNDFRLANDQDPLLGNHGINENCRGEGRMVIEGDAATKRPPYFCSRMPTLVETRGGDYFFVPSMTCLRMIGLGIIDPT
jgi:deferrochelatase/peroxidase EfeB